MFAVNFQNNSYNLNEKQSVKSFLNSIRNKLEANIKDVLVCRINSKLTDVSAILHKDSDLEIVTYSDSDGEYVFKHSSAHVLGAAILEMFPSAKLVNGPPVEEGFYYDCLLPTTFSDKDFGKLEEICKKICKENNKFVRKTVKRAELEKFYEKNKYKLHFMDKDDEKKDCVVYDMGNFRDYCRGPHIESTGLIKSFKIIKQSSVYFLGDKDNDSLTRIYGISFPSKELMDTYEKQKKAAEELNHRKIGEQMKLFCFHKFSPGCTFFKPNGTIIYNRLVDFLRKEYKKRGFKEVITPNFFSTDLWKQSGHLENYRENIYLLEKSSITDDKHSNEFALKPMNCPSHCLIFNDEDRSYRELPLRLADFGVLHRNELTGTLSGLTRVRKFSQDDAHIFCSKNDIKSEINSCLEFLDYVYKILGFGEYEIFLSTRPEKYMGEIEVWNNAESELKEAILSTNKHLNINEGDGAFYGPKIDIIISDALKRKHQCGTIQLDFQLPERFKLKFRNNKGDLERPVMIHRAILGSLERFIGLLLENYGKRLPFWISPRQIAIIPIKCSDEYLRTVSDSLFDYETRIFGGLETFNKKLRNAISDGYSLILIIGEKEEKENSVTIHKLNSIKIDDLINKLRVSINKYEYHPFFE